jgi:hypothetical protein
MLSPEFFSSLQRGSEMNPTALQDNLSQLAVLIEVGDNGTAFPFLMVPFTLLSNASAATPDRVNVFTVVCRYIRVKVLRLKGALPAESSLTRTASGSSLPAPKSGAAATIDVLYAALRGEMDAMQTTIYQNQLALSLATAKKTDRDTARPQFALNLSIFGAPIPTAIANGSSVLGWLHRDVEDLNEQEARLQAAAAAR